MGTWRVDLRPTPNAKPYFKEFVVERVDGKGFTGTFYGTPIENAQVNADWGRLRFAFTTSDGSGTYHTSGEVLGDRLNGTTHSIGRRFLAVWRAERAARPAHITK
ncbi:MAG: hypothetical protein H6837_01240 [Planctomycetes bacterium]|nr:hypothetical protein [Planctomycetota bacterium]